MPAPIPPEPETTRPQEHRSRGELANVLAVAALAAVVVAYLMAFTVLGDTNYASKFENGVLPAGFDGSAGRAAAVSSLGFAAVAVVAIGGALVSRLTKTAGIVAVVLFLAAWPYALLEMVTWQLAF